MKFFIALSVCLLTYSQAFALGEITFGGQSAKFTVSTVAAKATKSTDKSLFGSAVDVYTLGSLLVCRVKHGWVMESATCYFPGTSSTDILGTHVIDTSSDELTNSLSALNNVSNLSAKLRFAGASASRMYLVVSQLEGKDPGFYRQTGTTTVLKNPFDGVGTAEIYCQKTTGRILGERFQCVVPYATTADSNAPAVVVTDHHN